MKIGIGTYTFPWAFGVSEFPAPPEALTPEGLLELAARLDVEVVQFADNAPIAGLDPRRLDALAAMARERDLEIELGARGTSERELRPWIDLVTLFGARVLRTVPTAVVPLHDEAAEQGLVVGLTDELGPVAGELERLGCVLCIENYEGVPLAALAAVVERVGSPALRACIDTLNSLGRSEGLELLSRTLFPIAGNLHVKDYHARRIPGKLGFEIVGTPTGEGDLPVRSLLRAIPPEISAIVELWTPWQDNIEATILREREWCEASIRNLREIQL